jgi:hypothetical protein
VELRFLYVATADTGRDLAAWLSLPGATMKWRFRHFGADVAAIDLGTPPIVMLADHRPAGTVLPIYAVHDLDGAVEMLEGWTVEARLGTPEGPVALVRDASGNELALLRVDAPGAMDRAYADRANGHAVR